MNETIQILEDADYKIKLYNRKNPLVIHSKCISAQRNYRSDYEWPKPILERVNLY